MEEEGVLKAELRKIEPRKRRADALQLRSGGFKKLDKKQKLAFGGRLVRPEPTQV